MLRYLGYYLQNEIGDTKSAAAQWFRLSPLSPLSFSSKFAPRKNARWFGPARRLV
jgi:hypothetical protein